MLRVSCVGIYTEGEGEGTGGRVDSGVGEPASVPRDNKSYTQLMMPVWRVFLR